MVSIADINGDGRDDLVMQSSNSTVTDWLAQPNASFVHNSTNLTLVPSAGWHIVDPFVHDSLV